MHPLIILIGDMFLVNQLNMFFVSALFLFLLYVDKKWPEITLHLWLFILTNSFMNFLFIFSVMVYSNSGIKLDTPLFLSALFTISSWIPGIIFAIAEYKESDKKLPKTLIVGTVVIPLIILLVSILLALSLQT